MPNETYTEQWFSIGSAARKLNCHSDDIWHLIDTNRLNPLVKIPDFIKVEFISHPNKNSETLEFTCYLMPIDCFGPANVDKYAFMEHLNSVSGCFYLHGGNRLLHDRMCVDLFGIMIAPADPVTGDRLGTNIYKVIDSKKISSDDLIIPVSQIRALLEDTSLASEAVPMTDEDISQYVKQRRLAGDSDKIIAQELLQRKSVSGRFVSKEKIGRVMHPNPAAINDNTAFTHHVTALFGKD